MITSGHVPLPLRSGFIVPLDKGKGLSHSPAGFRPIVLLPTLLKLAHKLILFRIRAAFEDSLMLYQAAFREGLCAPMHVAALSELLARAGSGGHALHLCFCDFTNAYSSVRRDALFAMLLRVGVPDILVRFLRASHDEVGLRVRWNGAISLEHLHPRVGVMQGDPLAPYLFIMVMDNILRALPHECGAMCDWRMGLRLPCLAYADDVVLLANTQADLRRLLVIFEAVSSTWGLTLNAARGKTEWTRVPRYRGLHPDLSCSAGSVQYVTQYKYLGVLVGQRGTWRADLRRRIGLMHASIARSAALWAAPLSKATKSHLLQTLVLPILEYGLVAYPATKEAKLAVHRATSAILRRAYGVRVRWDDPDNHVSSVALYEHVPFALVSWADAVLSAFGHWARAGQRAGLHHPVVLTCAGATLHESQWTVRSMLAALAAPTPWEDLLAAALGGGARFRAVVRRAARSRFRETVVDLVQPHQLRVEHVPWAEWAALFAGWPTRAERL
jgi:hypothetical protein